MKFFNLINEDIVVTPNKKVIPSDEFSQLLNGKELLDKVREDTLSYKQSVVEECEKLKEKTEREGFEEGLSKWTKQLTFLVKETHDLKEQILNSIIPLAISSVKKIIGKELETNPDTIASIVLNNLKTITQYKTFSIFVNPEDLNNIEKIKPDIRKLLEYASFISIAAKDDIEKGGCVIETEVGIINARLDVQLQVLEHTFKEVLQPTMNNTAVNTPPQTKQTVVSSKIEGTQS